MLKKKHMAPRVVLGVCLFIFTLAAGIGAYLFDKNKKFSDTPTHLPLRMIPGSEQAIRGTSTSSATDSSSSIDKNKKEGDEDSPSPALALRTLVDQKIVDALGQIDEGDVKGGLEALKALAQQYPENETVLEELGMYLNEQEKWDQAYEYLSKLFQLNPNNAVAINELSQLIAQRDGREKALNFLLEQQTKFPDSPTILSTLAEFYAKEEKYDKALPLMEKIVGHAGGSVYELETISNIYTDQGNQEKAIHYLTRAISVVASKIDQSSSGDSAVEDEDKMTYNRLSLSLASNYIKLGSKESCEKADKALKSLHPMPFEMSSLLIVNEEYEKYCAKK